MFDGEASYIAYPPLTIVHDDLRVELEFKPLERDGLMFFCGGKKMKVEDFVAVSMVDGYVEFRYELGTGRTHTHTHTYRHKETHTQTHNQCWKERGNGKTMEAKPWVRRRTRLKTEFHCTHISNCCCLCCLLKIKFLVPSTVS